MILKRRFYRLLFFMALMVPVVCISCNELSDKEIEIRGIYGHPRPLWDKGFALSDLGINAVFVHSGSIDEKMIQKARSEGMKIYAEFATLNGRDYVEDHIEAWAVNQKGEHVDAASWFMGVCPTEPGFRQYRYQQLRGLLAEFDLDGIWMDYVHWHAQFEEPEPILPETCFCDNCLSTFSYDKTIEVPAGNTSQRAEWILSHADSEWRDWRCEVIAAGQLTSEILLMN